MRLTERKWLIVSPQLLTANGTSDGVVTVDDTSLFRVKQKVELVSLTQPRTEQDFLEIKRILSNTQMVVGEGKDINNKADLSAFLTTDIATIEGREQARSSIDSINIERGSYEEEPVLAKRVILVDKYGNRYDQENPIPVDATVSVVVPPVTVDLDALTPPTQTNPDNALMAGSEDGTKAGLKHAVRVDADLDLRVGISDGLNKAVVDAAGDLHVADEIAHTWLQDISQKLDSPIQVDGTINADMDAFNNTPDNVMTVGSIDGTKTGAKYGWVNNVKQQILAAHDRKRDAFYLDISSKKDRRLDKFEYTSPTFPGVTLVRQFSWTLVGTEYVYENDEWSVI